jgi:D-alanine-D-alanine ligase
MEFSGMKVGITYDLREDYLAEGYGEEETAEFDRPDTIEAIVNALAAMGFVVERIGNLGRLVKSLVEGGRWDIVFNIAEGLHGISREAQVPALLEAYRIPFTFSDPLVLSLTLHKGMTKRVVRSAGIPTPDFAEVATEADIEAVSLPFPLFAKPIAEGTGKGIGSSSKIETKQQLKSVALQLLEKFKQPVLVETYLPGREFTVGVVGTGKDARAIGAMEIRFNESSGADSYSYFTKANYEDLVEYHLVEGDIGDACKDLSLRAWRVLGCRDAGRIDIRMSADGIPNFIEVNPLAGLNPVHSDLPILCRLAGMSFQQLIEEIMESALKRYGLAESGGRG